MHSGKHSPLSPSSLRALYTLDLLLLFYSPCISLFALYLKHVFFLLLLKFNLLLQACHPQESHTIIATQAITPAESCLYPTSSLVIKPPARPNTTLYYTLFLPHTAKMPAGQLNLEGWRSLTTGYPDRSVIESILGICEFGACIGYEDPRSTRTIHPNLSTASDNPELVTTEIQTELRKHRLRQYSGYTALPQYFTASPLGLTDKSDGTKRRIHHLSYPPNTLTSINSGIPEQYGTIRYSSISDAVAAIQDFGPMCQLVKRDFENAFRHIPVSPIDTPLLGLHWQNVYYSEQYLPFGLRTAPYVFNLFAEIFHWILEHQLAIKHLQATVIHYLDDFLVILPPAVDPNDYSTLYSTLCTEVGLTIKESKNEQGTSASFGGIEIDTEKMVIRLPEKKLLKAQKVVQTAIDQTSLSLLDLQRITGYLNFVATVVPLGRTFLRRLYNMQLYFPTEHTYYRRRISSEAHKDLLWWKKVLTIGPERSIQKSPREIISMWSDAAGTKGLGAFYFDTNPQPKPGCAFSIALPSNLVNSKEHINTKEMRAVEQALLHWGPIWRGKRVMVHIDNRAVFHALDNQTIRGTSMDVLRRCLLLAAEYDLEIRAR